MASLTLPLTLAAVLVAASVLPSAGQSNDGPPVTPSAPGGFSQSQTTDADTPEEPRGIRGSTINNAANANQHAPGGARELAPDTKQSATGGPSGGYGRGGASGGN